MMHVSPPADVDSLGRGRHRLIERRQALQYLGVVGLTGFLAACGESVAVSDEAVGSSTTAAGTGSTSTALSNTGSSTAGSSNAASSSAEGWASGGTDLISVSYPETSVFASGDACQLQLTEATTLGPCYFQSDTGEDISLGSTGLPMQLCLQVTDTTCAPLAGYVVEVWHCDTRGTYSGDTSASDDASSFAGDFCTGGDDEAEAGTYFRGQLTTDGDGRVNFKTCFPGWYSGRSIHIHFAVTGPDGTTRVVSQFAIADELCDDICTTHELYADRGVQDTPVSGGTDTVFSADSYEDFLLNTEQNADGTLLGYAVIQIDPTVVATEAGGGAGAGGPGGEPPERPDA